MATLLAFESSDDASRTFYLVTRDHERRRRIKLSDPAALPDRGGACSHYTLPESEGKPKMVVLIIRDGVFLAELNCPLATATEESEDQLVARVLDAYREALQNAQ
jgi:hypothetical protein